ncbi:hypothetical protein, partial [Novipirellula artificiosorum]|uniref:hypothetical protein n=1 Tax=Novipirellula artificiosorum TaxID=2528016 RepID=UPI001E3BC69C
MNGRTGNAQFLSCQQVSRIVDVVAQSMVIRPLLSFCKYVIPGDNKPIIDPIEQWLYFFREAANQT